MMDLLLGNKVQILRVTEAQEIENQEIIFSSK